MKETHTVEDPDVTKQFDQKTISSGGGSGSFTVRVDKTDELGLQIVGDSNTTNLDIDIDGSYEVGGTKANVNSYDSEDLTSGTENNSKTYKDTVDKHKEVKVTLTNDAASNTTVDAITST